MKSHSGRWGIWWALHTLVLAWSIVLGSAANGVPGLRTVAHAEIPQIINYQGRLTELDGDLLTGSHTVTFRLYDEVTAGTVVWEEEHTIILSGSDNGIFSVLLGSVTDFDNVTFNQSLWLSLEVDNDGEMTPRQRLTAVGYAINADTLDSLNSDQFVRADVDTSAASKLTLTQSALALVIEPAADPAPDTTLLEVRRSDGRVVVSIDREGDLTLASADFGSGSDDDLTAADVTTLTGGTSFNADMLHTHTISGSDDLFDAGNPSDVGTASTPGVLEKAGRRDHVHQGLHALAASGQAQLFGNVTMAGGEGITLTQSGQEITVAEEARGKASTASRNSLAIATKDTSLLSLTMTKEQADSVLLILGTVQLERSSGNATVSVLLRRDGTLLDTAYDSRIGSGGGNVREDTVTIHSWDTSGAGSYTFELSARADGTGTTAEGRRLSVVELR